MVFLNSHLSSTRAKWKARSIIHRSHAFYMNGPIAHQKGVASPRERLGSVRPLRHSPRRSAMLWSFFTRWPFTPVAHLIFSVSIPSSLLSPCFTSSAILTGRFHQLPVDPIAPPLNPTWYWSHFNAAFLTPCISSSLKTLIGWFLSCDGVRCSKLAASLPRSHASPLTSCLHKFLTRKQTFCCHFQLSCKHADSFVRL